jgi:isopenicillin N synthase-like dioxygenase
VNQSIFKVVSISRIFCRVSAALFSFAAALVSPVVRHAGVACVSLSMPSPSNNAIFEAIPIVDVSARTGSLDERQALATKLTDLAHRVGFVIVTHHGLSAATMEGAFAASQEFFQGPVAVKEKINKKKSRHFRGWEPVGAEATNNRPDVREQVDIWSEHELPNPDTLTHGPKYNRLLGRNQWPDSPENFRDRVMTWFDECQSLADSIMGLFAMGLGLEEDAFRKLFGEKRMSLTKLIRYPQTPPGQFGVNAHHDTGFLTLLAPGNVAGLQVQNQKGDWISVPLVANALVLNLGEALQAMTGNYFVATPHRVKATAQRYACGYFHGPCLSMPLSPLELDQSYRDAVETSLYHSQAGFMTQTQQPRDTMEDDGGDSGQYERYPDDDSKPNTWGDLVWNYLSRSYPENMAMHYPEDT